MSAAPTKTKREAIEVGGTIVAAGTRASVRFPVARLASGAELSLPVTVVHGAKPGPTVWLSACIHGDELNGIEIIAEVLRKLRLDSLAGSLLAVPVVNVLGLLHGDRYLPDRRDLNRLFPGSMRGSHGRQLAALFMREIVDRSDFGIDLHTGSNHRINVPQLRVEPGRPEIMELAHAFGAPVIVHAPHRDGSLRRAAEKRGKPCLVYEAGEALRFDEESIRIGVAGVLRVLKYKGMIARASSADQKPRLITDSRWIRAGRGGLFRSLVKVGVSVEKGDVLGSITDPTVTRPHLVKATTAGVVIGALLQPRVYRGDALVHLGITPDDEP